MKLKTISAEININNQFSFKDNDGYLETLQVVLGEQERASSCNISLFDPGLKLLNVFLLQFKQQGGIYVPKDLFSEQKANNSDSNNNETLKSNTDATGYLQALEKRYGASDLSGLTPLGRKCYKALSDVNVRSFLDAIAVAELGEKAAANMGGYGYLYGDIYGKETFDPSKLNTHPLRRRTAGNYTSSATGRYQTMDYVWNDDTPYSQSGLGLKDFKPISQEILAVARLIYRKALEPTQQGNFESAFRGNGNRGIGAMWEWASLNINGRGAYGNQRTKPGELQAFLANIERFKKQYGGKSTSNTPSSEGIPSASESLEGLKDANKSFEVELKSSVQIFVTLQNVTYSFILTGLSGSDSQPHRTVLQGKQVKAIASLGEKENKIYKNTSIKNFAAQITAAIGADLIATDPGNDEIITIKQRNQTKYEALVKAAKDKGLFVRSDGTILKIERLKSDEKVRRIYKEALAPGSKWGDVSAQNRKIDIPSTVAGSPLSSDSSNTLLPKVDLSSLTPSNNSPGVLSLSEQADTEKGIGKGFKSTLNIHTLLVDGIYQWLPGDIISPGTGMGDFFDSGFRIDSIRHSWSSGVVATSIGIYLPVAIEKSGSSNAKSGDAIASPSAANTPDFDKWLPKWKQAAKRGDVIEGTGRRITSPFGYRIHPVFGDRRLHGGTDIDTPSGVALYAIVEDGKQAEVTYIPNLGGAGNVVKYVYKNLTFLYFHLASGRNGTFNAGQVIARSGNTGVGTGAHLHVEIYYTAKGTSSRFAIPLGYLYWILTGKPPEGV